MLKDNKALQYRVQQLEGENNSLKKSVFDLSARLNEVLQSSGKVVRNFFVPPFAPTRKLKIETKQEEAKDTKDLIDDTSTVTRITNGVSSADEIEVTKPNLSSTPLHTSDKGPFRLQYEYSVRFFVYFKIINNV